MTLTFDGTVIVPVADPDDGERTTRGLEQHLGSASTVVVVNVIEKAGGGIDKAPMGQREEYAEEIFDRAQAALRDSPATVEAETLYGTDVVETIFDEARQRDADAVVFNPREGNRLAELLTGDVARRMVKEAAVPVVALPQTTSE
ncbi:universal stress protein [Natrialba sp. INN-245]|uniref:universal stress protein n=1 Tax=Natrialba sp. INN-245 TaxID=2690967 RepID=UPI0013106C40|nr:universal stress protein [Natrialba sp. INN-245]MWV39594.1 universal stress protein [Natrialba sp. INN-245]